MGAVEEDAKEIGMYYPRNQCDAGNTVTVSAERERE